MTRDMELVRKVLLTIEQNKEMDGTGWFRFNDPSELGLTDCSYEQFGYTLQLLDQAGFINAKPDMRMPLVAGLTWQGHEFLDTIRDPEIWRRTKAGAKDVGSWSFDFVVGLAKEYAKQVAKERLGISLS